MVTTSVLCAKQAPAIWSTQLVFKSFRFFELPAWAHAKSGYAKWPCSPADHIKQPPQHTSAARSLCASLRQEARGISQGEDFG